jgi:DNA-binding SARP family transcriptional activator
MEIKVLGPLEALVGGVSIVPTASKPCRILAVLALQVGRVVTTAELIDEIWDQRPPRSAAATVQTYIMHLRRRLQRVLDGEALGSSAKNVLITHRSGYVLAVEPDDVDAVRYDRLSVVGRRAVLESDYATASRVLSEALDLWRGSALVGVPVGPRLGVEALRLEESRLATLDLRIDADLRLGRHNQVLGELAGLCARHPTLENFCAQYMLALYRSGRPTQALGAYRELRRKLVEEIGIEPSTRLRRVHQAMLTADPTLDHLHFVFSDWLRPWSLEDGPRGGADLDPAARQEGEVFSDVDRTRRRVGSLM